MKEKLQWIKPFAGIILVLFLLEVILSNWFGLTVPKNTHQVLVQDVWTNETGTFETDAIILDANVKNVYIALAKDGADQAEVTFSLTDEGDKYAYELPAKTVREDVTDTSYIALYPFGKVHTLQVTVNAYADSSVHLSSIEVNRSMPFRFHPGRFLFFLGFVLFVRMAYQKLSKKEVLEFFSDVSEGEEEQNGRNSKMLWILFACILVLIAVIGWKLVHINPIFANPPWPHHRQYQELAEALAKGQVYLDQMPSDGLLQAENPYDTIALQAEQISYLMDYTFYEGKYYVYFGIIPELLCFLPYYLLTGNHLANYQVIYLFYLLFAIGVFGLIRELFVLCKKKIADNPALYFLLSVAVCFLPNYIYILTRPDMYHIPIMSATAFLTLSLFLFLAGSRTEKKGHRIALLLLGAFCGAAVAGCRPQFLLYELLIFVVLWRINGKKKGKYAEKVYWEDWASVLIPYLLLGCFIFWYNKARFGSGFDFGATYSLTTNDMNHRGFSVPRMIQGLFSFLFQPADVRPVFPFVYKPEIHFGLMGRDLSEFTFGGMLTNIMFLWPVMIVPWLKKRSCEVQKFMAIGFLLCSLIICAYDANSAGILQRYMADGVWGFWIAAVLLWITIADSVEKATDETKRVFAGAFVFALTVTFLYGFCIIFATSDANSLVNTDPELYYTMNNWFH